MRTRLYAKFLSGAGLMAWVAAMLLLPLAASAADRLYVKNFTIAAGETKDVEVCLDNELTYCAFQTDVYLPAGLEFVMDGDDYWVDMLPERAGNHPVSTFRLPDGALRVFVASISSLPFNGHSGPIATLRLVAGDEAPTGRLELRGIVVVEEDGTSHEPADTFASVNGGGDPLDVNGDGAVDIGDVNAVLAAILGGSTDPLYDVNGDGRVDIGDVNAILAAILAQ